MHAHTRACMHACIICNYIIILLKHCVLHCHRAASIDKCRPDLLITESTYATTIRDSKRFRYYNQLHCILHLCCNILYRCRERDFLKKLLECVEKGGKVLIPVFALGRAQELCILLETLWYVFVCLSVCVSVCLVYL